ncbi:hypothetical protein K435DRAFT_336025 [Dendrothele bispora CBS 962.96]|uniref:Uncharacterized protein n=1 Tax=Dendrothele bispora (strain CBS 962.96) TaxID=1314807 RepID=A0A4S8LFE9_DENBC|nr:hypothetical protein K435DRAFT_336025 [Dendrothele bispora CBS 962.96]
MASCPEHEAACMHFHIHHLEHSHQLLFPTESVQWLHFHSMKQPVVHFHIYHLEHSPQPLFPTASVQWLHFQSMKQPVCISIFTTLSIHISSFFQQNLYNGFISRV